MGRKTIVSRVAAVVLIITTPWFLALTSVLPLLSPTFLRLQYARSDVPPSTKFTPQQRQAIAEAAAYYLISREGIEYLGDMRDNRGVPLFNERELTHMVDVKILLWKAIAVDVGLGLLLLGSLGVHLSDKGLRKRIPNHLLRAALVTLGLCVASMIVIPLTFGWLFVAFHHLFFAGDSWLFPRSDTLIQLFPETFWFNGVQTWVLLIVGGAVILGAGSYVWMRAAKRANAAKDVSAYPA
jgi:integral membrane protein (TIGR01906 family)